MITKTTLKRLLFGFIAIVAISSAMSYVMYTYINKFPPHAQNIIVPVNPSAGSIRKTITQEHALELCEDAFRKSYTGYREGFMGDDYIREAEISNITALPRQAEMYWTAVYCQVDSVLRDTTIKGRRTVSKSDSIYFKIEEGLTHSAVSVETIKEVFSS